MDEYWVLDIDASNRIGVEVDEETRLKLLDLPSSLRYLAMHRSTTDESYWPEKLDEIPIAISKRAETVHSGLSESDPAYLMWGGLQFISNEFKEVLAEHFVCAYFSPVILTGLAQVDSKPMSMFVLGDARDAICRRHSKYLENEQRTLPLRIKRIYELKLNYEALIDRPPLFELYGTSQIIRLLRSDLAEALSKKNLSGLLLKRIHDCTWDY